VGKFITSWLLEANADKCGTVEGLDVVFSGNVYVARLGHNSTDKFTDSGEFIKSWGSKGSGDNRIVHPWGIAIDSSGNLLITEQEGIIKKFTNEGKFITKWGSRGSEGFG
jgi:tripartite motif-containing protein 71